MRIDLSLRQLEAFVQVATSGSFRQAALQLGQSQPALSSAIRRAEQTLGARLFDRDTRQVRITATGQELLPVARRILRDFDHALGDLRKNPLQCPAMFAAFTRNAPQTPACAAVAAAAVAARAITITTIKG